MKNNKILMMALVGVMCCGDLNASGNGFPPPPPMSDGGAIGQQAPRPSGFSMWNRSNQQQQGPKQERRGFLGFGGKDSKRECKDAATLANKAQTCGDPILKKAFMDGAAKLNAVCERKPMRNPVQEAKNTAKKLRELGLNSNNPVVYTEIADSLDMAATGSNKGAAMGELMARQQHPGMVGQGQLQTQQPLSQQPGQAVIQGPPPVTTGASSGGWGWRR